MCWLYSCCSVLHRMSQNILSWSSPSCTCRQAGRLGEPGVAPTPKIHKTWDVPKSHFPPQIRSFPAVQTARGDVPGPVQAPRESQIPLLWLCRMCFPGCFQQEPRQLPSRWQQSCTRHCSSRTDTAPACRAQPEPSSDPAGPKYEFQG